MLLKSESDFEQAKGFLEELIEEAKGVDGLKDKVITILAGMGDVEDETKALLLKIVNLVETVTGDDVDESVVDTVVNDIYIVGTLAYKVLNGTATIADTILYLSSLGIDIADEQEELSVEGVEATEDEATEEVSE